MIGIESAVPRLVFGLGEEGAADARVVGRKAATLARLRSAGFPVPDGFVLTVDAVSRIPPSGGPVPADVRAALASALEAHGAGELAVRSSGVAEDLAGASFAGQYESVLGVRGLEELVSAVSRCWASALSERVSSYRAGARDAGMAVLAQDMVDADAAGVAFTANPVTGDTETVVNAVRGFGERLVSGEATPDEWVVRGTEVVSLARPEGAIDADEARRVADLARRVEEEFGGPQDIEWALAGGSLILLQARPITALPRRPELEPVGEGFWQKDAMHLPLPLTPFGASVYLPALRQGFRPMIEQFGLLLEGADLRSRGGEMYMRIIPVGGKDREPPPWWVLRLMSHLMPAIRRRERIAAGALRTDAPRRLIEQWNARWRDEFRHEASMLGGRDLAALEDEELLRHLDAAQAFLNRGRETHMLLDGAYAVSIYRLGQVAQELLGWDAVRTLALVSGTSAASSEPGRALETLTAAIAASASGCDVISQAGADVLERLHEVAPDAAGAFESYLEEHGRRTLSYDPGDVTLAERPELLAGLIRGRLSGAAAVRDPDAARREVVAQARSALATATEEERARFERALAAAEHAYPVREENVIWTDNVPSGLLRYTAVEIGRRLAERGAIAHAEDAVFLEQKELRAALRGGPRALRDLVAQRRAERAWVIAHPGPPSYGTEPSKPDLRGLPPAVRLVTGAVLYFLELSQPGARAEDGGIAGVPGSPGLHTGPARLIHEESEFSRLQPGDVLVCPITSPAWSLLFAQAGAVVTDGGGVLAHAAVIAREYAIPAVLATGDATRRLHDGELVTVDGTAGLVRIDAPAASAG